MRRCLVPLVVVLAACSGGHPRTVAAPPPSPPPSVAPSVASPSPEVLRFPATKEGAKAIAKAFYTEIGRADVTGDTTRFRAMIEASCPCLKAISTIREATAGDRKTGEIVTIRAIKVVIVRRFSAVMNVSYDVSPSEVRHQSGTATRFAGMRGELDALSLEENNGAWLVIGSRTLRAGKAYDA